MGVIFGLLAAVLALAGFAAILSIGIQWVRAGDDVIVLEDAVRELDFPIYVPNELPEELEVVTPRVYIIREGGLPDGTPYGLELIYDAIGIETAIRIEEERGPPRDALNEGVADWEFDGVKIFLTEFGGNVKVQFDDDGVRVSLLYFGPTDRKFEALKQDLRPVVESMLE